MLTSSDSGAVEYQNGNTCMFVGTLWKSVADVSKDGWQNLAIALKTPVLGSVSAMEMSRKLRIAGANLWLAAFATQACRPRDCSSRGQQELSHPISGFGNSVPATNGVGFGLRGGVVGPGLGTGGPGGPGGAGGIIMAVIIGGILG